MNYEEVGFVLLVLFCVLMFLLTAPDYSDEGIERTKHGFDRYKEEE